MLRSRFLSCCRMLLSVVYIFSTSSSSLLSVGACIGIRFMLTGLAFIWISTTFSDMDLKAFTVYAILLFQMTHTVSSICSTYNRRCRNHHCPAISFRLFRGYLYLHNFRLFDSIMNFALLDHCFYIPGCYFSSFTGIGCFNISSCNCASRSLIQMQAKRSIRTSRFRVHNEMGVRSPSSSLRRWQHSEVHPSSEPASQLQDNRVSFPSRSICYLSKIFTQSVFMIFHFRTRPI